MGEGVDEGAGRNWVFGCSLDIEKLWQRHLSAPDTVDDRKTTPVATGSDERKS